MTTSTAVLAEARAVARLYEPDRYVAALLAPRQAKLDLAALATFAADLERITATQSEPMMARIRLQWWRDALASRASDTVTGHPIADHIRRLIALEARLLDDLMQSIDAAEAGLDARLEGRREDCSAHFVQREFLALTATSRVLKLACDTDASRTCIATAAAALALAGTTRRQLERDVQQGHTSRGHDDGTTSGMFEHLQDLEKALRGRPRRWRLVLAPAAMVRPYLTLAHRSADARHASRPELLHLKQLLADLARRAVRKADVRTEAGKHVVF